MCALLITRRARPCGRRGESSTRARPCHRARPSRGQLVGLALEPCWCDLLPLRAAGASAIWASASCREHSTVDACSADPTRELVQCLSPYRPTARARPTVAPLACDGQVVLARRHLLERGPMLTREPVRLSLDPFVEPPGIFPLWSALYPNPEGIPVEKVSAAHQGPLSFCIPRLGPNL